MILRKPYAFLIKNFKIIHLIIAIFSCVIAYLYKNALSFFSDYINNGYIISLSETYKDKILPIYIFLILFVIIIFSVFLITLLYHKKKPVLFYFLLGIFYFVLFVYLLYTRGVLAGFKTQLLDSTNARIIHDMLILFYIPQFYFIIVCFVRAIGFNLKKFDFIKDMKELNLIASDNEEFELNVPFDNENLLRKIRKYFREMRYYFFENKLIILIILGIVFVLCLYYILTNRKENYDNNYSLNQQIIVNDIYTTFTDSVITNTDYTGKELDQYYMIVKVNFDNKSAKYKNLDKNKFQLVSGNDVISPIETYKRSFIDISPNKFPTSLSHAHSIDTILVYPLGNNPGNSYKIKIYNGTITVKKNKIQKSIYVKLKNKRLSSVVDDTRYHQNQTLTFDDTFLNGASFKILNCSLNNNYKYSYELCKDNVCDRFVDLIIPKTSNKMILVCNAFLSYDKNNSYFKAYNSVNDFIEHYVYIKDVKDSQKILKTNNVTPETATDFFAFEVPIGYANPSELLVAVRIRNYLYKIYLTD